MTTMSDLPRPKVRPASNWSAIWILPILALLIGGWLGWRAYSEAGIDIEVHFDSGEGIVAGKTEVIYKGMPVGKVKKLALNHDGDKRDVIASIEMDKAVEPSLLSGTRFWLVKPSVTLAGISGLETLLSGNYIAVTPGEGTPQRTFKALAEIPPLPDDQPGLHLTLNAERLGSLNKGSPVFYKQIKVGRVKSYQLAKDKQSIEVKVFIEPAYSSLVRKHTRFWNASGISVEADLSGVKVRTESLASLVAGGIAFATPESRPDSPPTDPSIPFRLYEDFDAAQAGIKVFLKLTDFEGLQAGRTPVMYKGIQVGTVKKLNIDSGLNSANAELTITPQAEDYLVEGTQFWMVKPSISLAGVNGLEALVKGNYIAIRPGKKGGTPTREFEARAKVPPLDLEAPGLHLVLSSEALGSLDIGSPVLYRQIKVGSIQSFQLSRKSKTVLLGVHIQPEYAHLVNTSTQFWNASGITLKGGLSGIEVKSESLQTLLVGGVAFDTPDFNAKPITRRVSRFKLYSSEDLAQKKGQLITIRLDRADGLNPGAPIRYKGLDVGTVETIDLSDDLRSVLVSARITSAASRIARSGTQFWVIKPEVGISKVNNLETLLKGRYLEVSPATKPGEPQTVFTALSEPPNAAVTNAGLRLVLSAPRRGSLDTGAPVTYRQVKVGEVVNYELGATADRVLIHVLIEPRYAKLVHTGSRFWTTSGIGVDAGLFSGVQVQTESLESIIAGGVSFATPDVSEMGSAAKPGQTFALFDAANEEWLQWAPKIRIGK